MSSLPLTFHRDKEGVARAVWSGEDEAASLLAQFFEAELGADAAYCDRLLAEAHTHRQGRGPAWRTSGNLFAVSIDGSTVSLQPLFGANQSRSYTLAVAEFARLLHNWRELVH